MTRLVRILGSLTLFIMGGILPRARSLSNTIPKGFGRKSGVERGPHAIQKIFDELNSIKDITASVRDPGNCPQIGLCMDAMEDITLDCLGITDEYLSKLKEAQCMTVYTNDKFHIAAFLIPPGMGLPLHDHPCMAVLSKVVSGAMNVQSFTPSAADAPLLDDVKSTKRIPISLYHSALRTPVDKTWFLSPTEGNVHEFVAESPCVVFDILMPPYEEPERPCNYYESCQDTDGNWWLIPAPEPKDLPYSVHYSGVRPLADKRAAHFRE